MYIIVITISDGNDNTLVKINITMFGIILVHILNGMLETLVSFCIVLLQNSSVIGKMPDCGFIVCHQPVMKFLIYFAYRKAGIQRYIPGVIAVSTFIDTPYVEHFLL